MKAKAATKGSAKPINQIQSKKHIQDFSARVGQDFQFTSSLVSLAFACSLVMHETKHYNSGFIQFKI
jgi:hypothetical protein